MELDSIALAVTVRKQKWHHEGWRGFLLYFLGTLTIWMAGSYVNSHPLAAFVAGMGGCCLVSAAIRGNAPGDITVEPTTLPPNGGGQPSTLGPEQLMQALRDNPKQLKGEPN